jgi:phospholipase C
VPTETMPNRAFTLAATCQGRLNDSGGQFTAPTIFSLLSAQKKTWAVYGYEAAPLTKNTFSDIAGAPASNFGQFTDFQKAVKSGKLANFVFLEPSWNPAGNSQHPNYDLAAGEALILQVYNTLFGSKVWEETLLIVTYDEHGGCYDHMVPPAAMPPDSATGPQGFTFNRLGVRVPTVLVSPWIPAGTVYRVTQGAGGTPLPFDHTSTLKTVEKRFGLSSLTQRDAAALDVGGVLSLSTARTDNPLQGVQAPVNPSPGRVTLKPSHLQLVQAQLLSEIPTKKEDQDAVPFEGQTPAFKTGKEADEYIRKRSQEMGV